MIEPVDAPVSQEWGLTRFARDNPGVYAGQPGHRGRDYASLVGTDVRAPERGSIVFVGTNEKRRSWGYYVEMESAPSTSPDQAPSAGSSREPVASNARRHFFCHLRQGSAVVAPGGQVAAGDLMARSGGTPNWPPHLHWEIRAGGPAAMSGSVDPRALLHPDRYTQTALRAYARGVAEQAGIEPLIFARQITRESGWNMHAHSPAGAIGVAQIVPRWHPSVNPWDPYAALDYATALMASHLSAFGSYELALAAYNAGPTAVRRHGGVPPFRETRNYVNSILGERKVRPVSNVYDDPDFWLKAKWEELAATAIQVVNRANAGVAPANDESRFLNRRYKDLIDDWPRLMEAEKQRAEVS